MNIISYLILDESFIISHSEISNQSFYADNCRNIRLYCKKKNIDENIFINFSRPDTDIEKVKELVENNHFFRIASGEKVFLQFKTAPFQIKVEPSFFMISFIFKKTQGVLMISAENFMSILKIMGLETTNDKVQIDEEKIINLEKFLFKRISNPPQNLGDIMLTLPDPDLQMVLNRILHLNLVTPDMLAGFIYFLDENGKKILDNLSSSLKMTILEKINKQKIYSTFRWMNQVKYIVNRNIYKAIDDIGLNIAGLQKVRKIRYEYLLNTALKKMKIKSVGQWLLFFEENDMINEFLNSCSKKILAGALSFIKEDDGIEFFILGKHISGNGLKILRSDISALKNEINISHLERISLLLRCFRIIKDIYYLPVVRSIISDRQFEKSSRNILKDNKSNCLDFIIDEIGFAKPVYALKDCDPEWFEPLFSAVIKTIFEDVVSGKIWFLGYGEYSINDCKIDFLKTAYILNDEGFI
jgi:hypothetical protein